MRIQPSRYGNINRKAEQYKWSDWIQSGLTGEFRQGENERFSLLAARRISPSPITICTPTEYRNERAQSKSEQVITCVSVAAHSTLPQTLVPSSKFAKSGLEEGTNLCKGRARQLRLLVMDIRAA